MLCLSYYCYVFSSTKSEKKRAEYVLPAREGGEGKRKGVGAGAIDGPDKVCT
jgi:hypothetical protein